MTLDEKLLAEVRAARARMEDLEDAAWGARAELHRAVRRLHHAGGSLREIATELGMSHQRVHQIVEEDAVTDTAPSGGTVPTIAPPREDTCTFCEAPRREVDRMLTGPGGTFVCSSCVVRARQALDGDLKMAAGRHVLAPIVPDEALCTFCRNAAAEVGAMVERDDHEVRMCGSCLEACERMLSPSGKYRPKGPAMKRRALVRCSFCNVSQKNTKKLIAGPGVYICEFCVAAASAVAAGAPSSPSRSAVLRTSERECAFCGKARAKVNEVVASARGRICNECLDLCHDILHEDAGTQTL
jgi:hypothetical protein